MEVHYKAPALRKLLLAAGVRLSEKQVNIMANEYHILGPAGVSETALGDVRCIIQEGKRRERALKKAKKV